MEHKTNRNEKSQSSTDSSALVYWTEISLNRIKHQCQIQKPIQCYNGLKNGHFFLQRNTALNGYISKTRMNLESTQRFIKNKLDPQILD